MAMPRPHEQAGADGAAQAHHGDLRARQALAQPGLALDDRVFVGHAAPAPEFPTHERSFASAAQGARLTARPDWPAFRALFPTLQHKTYLASGSYGLLAAPVEAAFRRYLDDRLEKGVDWGGWGERHEAVRDAVAGLLNAQADEIAVTTSASAGINSLASALRLRGAAQQGRGVQPGIPHRAQIWHAQASRGAIVEHAPEAPTAPCRWSTSTGRSTSGPSSSRSPTSATATARGSTWRAW